LLKQLTTLQYAVSDRHRHWGKKKRKKEKKAHHTVNQRIKATAYGGIVQFRGKKRRKKNNSHGFPID